MPVWLSILFAGCTVLALAGVAFCIFTSVPAAMRRQVTLLQNAVREVQMEMETLTQKWNGYKAEMASIVEHVEDLCDTVERKRRRAAARESRERAAEELPVTREQHLDLIRRQARAAGMEGI